MYRLNLRRFAVVVSLFLFACSAPTVDTASLIADQGPLAISKKYEDVSANIYLNSERMNSPLLNQFLMRHSLPDYVELSTLGSYPELRLFYLSKNELFRLAKKDQAWLITHEEEIPTPLREQLLANSGSSAATNTAEDDKKGDKEKNEPNTNKEDYIHITGAAGETLAAVVKWYTGDEANAEAIKRINDLKISPTAPLEPGSKILIPSYLLKTKVSFTGSTPESANEEVY
ncbi:MAG: hypothetical protein IT292_09020 [Deltaproteobacteria bacterium]|nr:hypothetical protein [Deltaproteobacteria bacterium]